MSVRLHAIVEWWKNDLLLRFILLLGLLTLLLLLRVTLTKGHLSLEAESLATSQTLLLSGGSSVLATVNAVVANVTEGGRGSGIFFGGRHSDSVVGGVKYGGSL
jgi:hypothetical protein